MPAVVEQMTLPNEEMLDHLPWYSLQTEHEKFAQAAGSARKYPEDVTPFAATSDYSAQSMKELATLLGPGEKTYLMGEAPSIVAGLVYGEVFPCLQMILLLSGQKLPKEDPAVSIVPLTNEDAPAMVELTNIAFPGFFRIRTCEMGTYFGIRTGNELVAMAGERMALPGYREISGVCTHPAHRGKGYAVELMARLMKEHARAGMHSFLHVSSANTTAIPIYKKLGFTVRREVLLYPVSR
jgi:ribosomal protein S18 acetylase RimI-like enzyme